MGWHTTMRRAKAKHRPELDDWEGDGLFEVFPAFVSSLSEDYEVFIPSQQDGSGSSSYQHQQVNASNKIPEDIPAVVDATTLSVQEFASDYEAKKIPLVIRNIPRGHDGGKEIPEWRAMRDWGFFSLENDPELRERAFKCGEDDDGSSIKVKMKHFLKYLQNNHDDSPLYIFDSAFEDDRIAKKILRDYKVPSYFKEDLFRLCSERRRPPYRWFLVGPERSGTSVHIDPLATSAWNTLIHGQKRWVLFPPHVPKSVVKGRDLVRDDEDDEPIHYFMYILPRIKRKAAAACFCSTGTTSVPVNSDYKDFACYEFTQNPGETVFIPNGWWHAVLNLTHTVGITQNFCSSRNFDDVWMKTRSGRKRLAWKWLTQLEIRYPHLAQRARQLNARDKFLMKYDPAVIQMREERRAASKEGKRQYEDDEDNTCSTTAEDEKEEKTDDARPPPPPQRKAKEPFVQSKPQVSYMDRSWKRSRIVTEGEVKSRPVSPP